MSTIVASRFAARKHANLILSKIIIRNISNNSNLGLIRKKLRFHGEEKKRNLISKKWHNFLPGFHGVPKLNPNITCLSF